MVEKMRNRVRRRTRAGSVAYFNRLRHQAKGLGGDPATTDEPSKRRKRWVPAHLIEAIKALALTRERRLDGERKLQRAKKRRNALTRARDSQAEDITETREGLKKAEEHRDGLESRFPQAKELLRSFRESNKKFVITVSMALAADFALNLVAMSFLVPSVAAEGLLGVLLGHLDLIGAVAITWGEALAVKYAGREAAWGFNPLTRGPAEQPEGSDQDGKENREPTGPDPFVTSFRSKRSHQVGFAVLVIGALSVLVALVALREPALALLSGLAGGNGISGVAAGAATEDHGTSTGVIAALFGISLFPLCVAGYVSYIKEQPLPSVLAELRLDVTEARGAVKNAIKALAETEVDLADTNAEINLIRLETATDQELIDLAALLAEQHINDANPGVFGRYMEEERPTMLPDHTRFGSAPEDQSEPEPELVEDLPNREAEAQTVQERDDLTDGTYEPPKEVSPTRTVTSTSPTAAK